MCSHVCMQTIHLQHHDRYGGDLTSILAQCRKTCTVRFRLDLAAAPFRALPCAVPGTASTDALPAALPLVLAQDSLVPAACGASGAIIMLPPALGVRCSLEACMLGSAGALWGCPRALGLAWRSSQTYMRARRSMPISSEAHRKLPWMVAITSCLPRIRCPAWACVKCVQSIQA